VGDFVDGSCHGLAHSQWLDCAKIWQDNKGAGSRGLQRHAKGKPKMPYIYDGLYENDKKNDPKALVTLKDGTMRRGPWKNGTPVGDWWSVHTLVTADESNTLPATQSTGLLSIPLAASAPLCSPFTSKGSSKSFRGWLSDEAVLAGTDRNTIPPSPPGKKLVNLVSSVSSGGKHSFTSNLSDKRCTVDTGAPGKHSKSFASAYSLCSEGSNAGNGKIHSSEPGSLRSDLPGDMRTSNSPVDSSKRKCHSMHTSSAKTEQPVAPLVTSSEHSTDDGIITLLKIKQFLSAACEDNASTAVFKVLVKGSACEIYKEVISTIDGLARSSKFQTIEQKVKRLVECLGDECITAAKRFKTK
jgi:hypothetical protein